VPSAVAVIVAVPTDVKFNTGPEPILAPAPAVVTSKVIAPLSAGTLPAVLVTCALRSIGVPTSATTL
jgi:hypothetical protein